MNAQRVVHAFPEGALRLRGRRDRLTRFRSSEHGTRSFCSRCGSTLFCESTHHPDVIDVVLANLHGATDPAPQCPVYYDDRADWVVLDDALPRCGGETGLEPLDG